MKKPILYTGAIINLTLAGFHAMFWKRLNWSEQLALLTPANSSVIQVENICMILLLVFFAVMSVRIARQRVMDSNGRSVLLMVAAFYTTRLVLGYPFFGVSAREITIWILCAATAAAYATIALRRGE
jgi:hypothetical protein